MKRRFFLVVFSIVFLTSSGFSQDKKKNYLVTCVGYYNLENLFDTLIDQDTAKILQDDFTPKGKKGWTSKRYHEKLDNMSRVIADLGKEVTPDGIAVLGVSEIENKSVLEDLLKTEKLKKRGYKIVHYESPDKRGIDVGLLYNPNYFEVTSSRSITLRSIDTTFFTRDQLLVSGLLNGEEVHVIVTHWPSRSGGEKRSRPKRASAATLGRSIIDSLQQIDPEAKIIYMGDLNDDPTNVSVKKHLKSVGNIDAVKKGDMYNPWEGLYKKGIGTLAYKGAWNLFDQILVTPSLIGKDYATFKYYKNKIYRESYLIQSTGKYKGAPHRTFSFGAYIGGYSDHFPVYIFLIKEQKNK